MGKSKERKEQDYQAQREDILDTAEALLLEKGPEKMSLRMLAGRMNYAPASLYYYFKDKDEIIRGVIERGGARLGMRLKGAVEGLDNPLDALEGIFLSYLDFCLEKPELIRLVYRMETPGVGVLPVRTRGMGVNVAFIADLLERAGKEGLIATADYALLARSVWVASQGLASRLAVETGLSREEKKEAAEEYFRFILWGVKGEKQ